ncbi:MAG: hypothetical protein RBG13Loki_1695 [Promethearchaeota archaeon CR_4]|nr:MAG: hypothetical protein RBG13Loki_1695 [Candidatus Lokiarchaeota archaeon CR_4]
MSQSPKLPPKPKAPALVPASKGLCLFCKQPVGLNPYICPSCKQEYHRECALNAKREKKNCKKCGQVMLLK